MPGRADWGLLVGPGIRNPTAEEMKSRFEHRRAVYKAGDDVETARPGERVRNRGGPRPRAALGGPRGHLLPLAPMVPQGAIDRAVLEPVMVQEADGGATRFLPVPRKDEITKEQKDLPREFVAGAAAGGRRARPSTSYWGSKDYDRLKALPYGLEETVELGSFELPGPARCSPGCTGSTTTWWRTTAGRSS